MAKRKWYDLKQIALEVDLTDVACFCKGQQSLFVKLGKAFVGEVERARRRDCPAIGTFGRLFFHRVLLFLSVLRGDFLRLKTSMQIALHVVSAHCEELPLTDWVCSESQIFQPFHKRDAFI